MNDHRPLSCPLAELLAGRPPTGPAPLPADDVDRIAVRVVELLTSPAPGSGRDGPGASAGVLGKVWFSIRDAATYTGRGRSTILRAIHAGELDSDQRARPGAHHRIHREELDRWMCAGRPRTDPQNGNRAAPTPRRTTSGNARRSTRP